jgi:hypothetical protein
MRTLLRSTGPGLLVTGLALVAATLLTWVLDPRLSWSLLALACLAVAVLIIAGLVFRPEERLVGSGLGYGLRDMYIELVSRETAGLDMTTPPARDERTALANLVPPIVAALLIVLL